MPVVNCIAEYRAVVSLREAQRGRTVHRGRARRRGHSAELLRRSSKQVSMVHKECSLRRAAQEKQLGRAAFCAGKTDSLTLCPPPLPSQSAMEARGLLCNSLRPVVQFPWAWWQQS